LIKMANKTVIWGKVELQIPPLRFAPVGGCDFFDFFQVWGRKALKSIGQQPSSGSFDSAPETLR
jgi:hypothetical protein